MAVYEISFTLGTDSPHEVPPDIQALAVHAAQKAAAEVFASWQQQFHGPVVNYEEEPPPLAQKH
jgi:hypothetical protein